MYTLKSILFVYVAEKDYYTIFPDRNPKNKDSSTQKSSTTSNDDNGEKIYEVGADGTVDISL